MTTDPARRRMLWIELGVVLTLYYVPFLWSGLTHFAYPRLFARREVWADDANRFVSDIGTLGPIIFILWASGDRFQNFGIRAVKWWQAISLTLTALFVGLIAPYILVPVIHAAMPQIYHDSLRISRLNVLRPSRDWETVVVRSLLFAVGAFSEEFVMRGYLIARVRELVGRTWVALLVSSVMFASYHIYEGVVAVIDIFAFGLIYGVVYLVARSIWPGTVAHALTNILRVLVLK